MISKDTIKFCLVASLLWSSASVAADAPPLLKAPIRPSIPTVSGYLGLYAGWSSAELEGALSPFDPFATFKDTLHVFGGHGRVNIWTMPGALVQLDVEAEGTTGFDLMVFGANASRGGRLHGIIGGHFSIADPERYSAGVLAAVIGADSFFAPGSVLTGSNAFGLLGLEGQSYLGNLTLYGQGGYGMRISGPEFTFPAGSGLDGMTVNNGADSFRFVRGIVRYYLTPIDKLEGEIGYASLKYDVLPFLSQSGKVLNWGATYEHRIANTPWSWYAEYAGFRKEVDWFEPTAGDNKVKTTEHIGMIGLRAHFNHPDLISQERYGARYDMPKFIRSLPWAGVFTQPTAVVIP